MWVGGGSRSHSGKQIKKNSQNSTILVLTFCGSIPCVFTLLKVVSHASQRSQVRFGMNRSARGM